MNMSVTEFVAPPDPWEEDWFVLWVFDLEEGPDLELDTDPK